MGRHAKEKKQTTFVPDGMVIGAYARATQACAAADTKSHAQSSLNRQLHVPHRQHLAALDTTRSDARYALHTVIDGEYLKGGLIKATLDNTGCPALNERFLIAMSGAYNATKERKWLYTHEAAELRGVSVAVVRDANARGDLAGNRTGSSTTGYLRIPFPAFASWCKECGHTQEDIDLMLAEAALLTHTVSKA